MLLLSRKYQLLFLSSALSLATSAPGFADTLSQTIQTENATQKSAIKSQKNIDSLDDRTRKMLEQYRSATRHTKTLVTYNTHLQALLDSQEEEKASFTQQL